MKMHVLSGGRLRLSRAIYFPDAPRGELFELPVSSALLRHPQGNVLFDTGCHPLVVTDPEARWGALARLMTPVMAANDNVVSNLAAIGVEPGDIDVVVCSHLHTDHCGCNAFFTRATVLVHQHEIAAARASDAEARGYLRADWDHPLPIDEVSGERDVFGDGRIVLLPFPGHTPGTMGAMVQLERNGTFLLASDTVSVRENLDQGIAPRHTWDVDALHKSLAEIRRIESQGVTIICGHDDRQWQTLRRGADAYD